MKHRNFTRSFSAQSYTGRRLRNPFFSHEPRKVPIFLFLAIFSIVAIGIVCTVIYAPFFRYREIRVEGLTTLSPEQVSAAANEILDRQRLFIIPGRNIFFAGHNDIEQSLMSTYTFAELALKREGRTLVITAEERITQIAWINENKTYLVDLVGIAVSEASAEATAAINARRNGAGEVPFAPGLQPTMPLIINLSPQEVIIGQSVIAEVTLGRILQIDKELRARQLLPISYSFENNTAPWTTVDTNQTALLIDVTKDLTETLASLDAFRHERDEPLEQLLYIDLRFGNHVYIKTR